MRLNANTCTLLALVSVSCASWPTRSLGQNRGAGTAGARAAWKVTAETWIVRSLTRQHAIKGLAKQSSREVRRVAGPLYEDLRKSGKLAEPVTESWFVRRWYWVQGRLDKGCLRTPPTSGEALDAAMQRVAPPAGEIEKAALLRHDARKALSSLKLGELAALQGKGYGMTSKEAGRWIKKSPSNARKLLKAARGKLRFLKGLAIVIMALDVYMRMTD